MLLGYNNTFITGEYIQSLSFIHIIDESCNGINLEEIRMFIHALASATEFASYMQ
jgi:hypothetical protein